MSVQENEARQRSILANVSEQKLKESEAQFKDFFDKAADAIFIAEQATGIIVDANQAASKLMQLPKDRIIGLHQSQLHPQTIESFSKNSFNLHRKEINENISTQPIENQLLCSDGSIIPVEVLASEVTLNGKKCLMGTFRDITERKKVDEELSHSRDLMRYIIEHSRSAIAVHDKDLRYIYVSQRYLEEYKIKGKDIIGMHHYEVLPDIPQKWRDVHQKALNGIVCSADDDSYIREDGSMQWTRWECRPWYMADGSIGGIIIYTELITERKQAEVKLQESENRLNQLAEHSRIIAWEIDSQGRYTYISHVVEQVLGYSPEEIAGKKFVYDLAPEKEREEVRAIVTGFCKNPVLIIDNEYARLSKEGNVVWVSTNGIPVFDDNNQFIGYRGSDTDITRRKKVELELKASEDQYRTMIENSNDLIWTLDINGNFLFLNKVATETTGLVLEEWIGKSFLPLIMEEDLPMILDIFQKGLKGISCNYDLRFKKADGCVHTISTNTSTIYNSGTIAGIVSFGRDITEKREVEKRVKLLAHSLEGISECVSITDNKDNIIYANEAFQRTYGYTENELVGQHISMLRPAEMKNDHLRDIFNETINGGWRGEIMNQKKDGTLFPILLSTSVIKDEDEKPIALIGVALDITEIKRNREELEAARRKAEENNNLKSAFLTNMSHEIRTPMNAIVGFADLMIDAGPEEKNTFAAIVQKSSRQLLELIENVIQLSRLQSEQIPLYNIDFCPANLLKEIYSHFNWPELRKNLHFTMSIPEEHKSIVVWADENKVRQIFSNLISNALKYTVEGTVEIGFDIQGGNLRFFVTDTGIGISEQEQSRIFDNFYRGEKAITLAIGGVGLGLSISKELVRLIGGQITLRSTLDQGSQFSFTIPLEQSNEVLTENPDRVHLDMKELIVLVADDEPINIQFFESLLNDKVKRIDFAYNGKEAIELVAKNDYSIVLMDLKMPVMSGIEATKQLKRQFPDLPIIAQTAYSLPEEREIALQAGCDDFISKPIKKERLFEMILKYV
jgi:PAS domain S-box-containing protein